MKESQPIEKKVISRIYGRGRGWAFTKTDFIAEFGEQNIHQALSALNKAGTIRRVCHGLYDYPRQSQTLGELSPDIDQVAHALARKFNWRIQPSGDTALNLLGLSTQVPGKWTYLSDGPSRQYQIGMQGIAFRHAALKDTGLSHYESSLLVQALKALGKDQINDETIEKLRHWLAQSMRKRVLQDTSKTTGWVFELIKRICEAQ